MRPRQAVFVAEYLLDLNATAAALRAGYSAKTAYSQGQRLLKNVEVQRAVTEAQMNRAKSTLIDADYVLNKIRETVERCSQGEPVLDREGNETGEWRFDSSGVLKGCELLGKHLGMFKDKEPANDSGDRIVKAIADAAKRLAGTA